jgi:hypothetical protein
VLVEPPPALPPEAPPVFVDARDAPPLPVLPAACVLDVALLPVLPPAPTGVSPVPASESRELPSEWPESLQPTRPVIAMARSSEEKRGEIFIMSSLCFAS